MWRLIAVGLVVTAQATMPPETVSWRGAGGQISYPLYPRVLDDPPESASPWRTEDGKEIVTAVLKNAKYTLMPVTVENGKPLHYSQRVPFAHGKDQQLYVDRDDFPSLAATGLHAEAELDAKNRIAGLPVEVITYIGRPGRFSGAGFLGHDEDILSVLKGDDHLVRTLGLTHPQMAKPLYHVWNMILQEIESGTLQRFSNLQHFLYNKRKVLLRAEAGKGWQTSIFQDEIQGRFDIDVQRPLTPAEQRFLQGRYPHLSRVQRTELQERLTHLHFSEMAPYYIMRYGFYEGHTRYRADPIAVRLYLRIEDRRGDRGGLSWPSV